MSHICDSGPHSVNLTLYENWPDSDQFSWLLYYYFNNYVSMHSIHIMLQLLFPFLMHSYTCTYVITVTTGLSSTA